MYTFVEEKSEALAKLKEFKAIIENQSSCRIKVLQSARGGDTPQTHLMEFAGNKASKTN